MPKLCFEKSLKEIPQNLDSPRKTHETKGQTN